MLIAPSILSADFAKLGEEVEAITKGGADWVHIDVMDGHFVPNITIGPCVVGAIRSHTNLHFDTHLMIDHPEQYVPQFLKAGSDRICFHLEAAKDPAAVLKKIHEGGAKTGIALKPGTPIEKVYPYLDQTDMVLVMTVEPGFGGQKFMADMMDKVKAIKDKCPQMLVEIDGGVNLETIGVAAGAGVNVCVAGTAVFGKTDYAAAIRELKEKAREALL